MARPQRFDILTFPMPEYDAIEREWQWAERLGFDQGWVPETWTLADRPYLEPWTLLSALARATNTLRLGTLVALLVRHPTLLAGHVLTVDQISKGRVELGIGAGDVPTDSGIFGEAPWSAGERVERLHDKLGLLDDLLRGRSVTSTGRHYSVTGARLPEPVQRPHPPLVVAAEGKKSLRLVARYADAWVTFGGQPQTPERGVPTVSEAQGLEATRERVNFSSPIVARSAVSRERSAASSSRTAGASTHSRHSTPSTNSSGLTRKWGSRNLSSTGPRSSQPSRNSGG